MPKPRIFIAIHYMYLGGGESALLGLLQSLDTSKVDVDLFVYSHEGELMSLIPKGIHLLPEQPVWSMLEKPIKLVLKKGYVRMATARMVARLRMSAYVRKNRPADYSASHGYIGAEVTKVLPHLFQYGIYDLAISFMAPHDFVLEHVLARKKICWIHTDYSHIDVNATLELPVWDGYDQVVSISADVTKTFLQKFPSLMGKVIEIENILSSKFVFSRAAEKKIDWEREYYEVNKSSEVQHCHSFINLLSVGRFCEAKNYDNVPDICRRLIGLGCEVRWFIIGYGGDELLVRQRIKEANMQDRVIILGKKDNPYPYIKACDVYVQPSRYEGKSVTVREAQMLCRPVIVANYPTASSQVQDGVDGIIVPMDNDGCAKGIADLITDGCRLAHIKEYLESHDYSNETEVDKLYQML